MSKSDGIDQSLLAHDSLEDDPSIDILALARMVSSVNSARAGVTPRERLMAYVLATLLPLVGFGSMTSAWHAVVGVHPEVESRLSSCEETARMIRDIYDIVDAAHPPRGRIGVPQPSEAP